MILVVSDDAGWRREGQPQPGATNTRSGDKGRLANKKNLAGAQDRGVGGGGD